MSQILEECNSALKSTWLLTEEPGSLLSCGGHFGEAVFLLPCGESQQPVIKRTVSTGADVALPLRDSSALGRAPCTWKVSHGRSRRQRQAVLGAHQPEVLAEDGVS